MNSITITEIDYQKAIQDVDILVHKCKGIETLEIAEKLKLHPIVVLKALTELVVNNKIKALE